MSYAWIDHQEGLRALASSLSGCEVIALDTEANGFHAYRPKMCLAQFAWQGEQGVDSALVDPLAVRDGFSALKSVLEQESGRTLVMHGASFDVSLLKRDAGISPRGLFDTEVAARLLGRPRTGLATLAAEVCGIEMDKGARRTNWGKRPLQDRALEYAARDVTILLPIRDALAAELHDRGRTAWAVEEFAAIERVPAACAGLRDAAVVVGKLKGAGRLDLRSADLLRRLVSWRESEALARDIPAAWIIDPKILVALAEARPESIRELVRLGVRGEPARRYGSSLLQIIATRETQSVAIDRSPSTRSRARPDSRERARQLALREQRDALAHDLGIAPGVLCPAEILGCIARTAPETTSAYDACGMRRWQQKLLCELFAACLASLPPG